MIYTYREQWAALAVNRMKQITAWRPSYPKRRTPLNISGYQILWVIVLF